MQASTEIKVLHDEGKGRAFCFLTTNIKDAQLADAIKEKIEIKSRLLIIGLPTITVHNWQNVTSTVHDKLTELKIRQVSFVGFDSSCVIAQNIALNDKKLVRSLVLLNATTRATPTFIEKTVQKIEDFLPLGLPLRKNSQNFDSKPFLQRLRCPTLLLSDNNSDDFVQSEQKVLKKRLPIAWQIEFKKSLNDLETEIAQLISDFELVPAKCPQKNR